MKNIIKFLHIQTFTPSLITIVSFILGLIISIITINNKDTLIEMIKIGLKNNEKYLEIFTRLESYTNEHFKLLGEIQNLINNFISDFILNFDLKVIYNYLDSLTLHQEGALFHIIIFSTILVTIFNILGIFFGNEIIKYFNIENKFPSLSNFFKLRAKLQRYYLMWNITILFVLCIGALGINILVFILG